MNIEGVRKLEKESYIETWKGEKGENRTGGEEKYGETQRQEKGRKKGALRDMKEGKGGKMKDGGGETETL